jgi:hypothetical protein
MKGEEARESVTDDVPTRESNAWWSSMPDLATFLIDTAVKNRTLANYFYWYVRVECEAYSPLPGAAGDGLPTLTTDRGRVWRQMYAQVLRRLSRALLMAGDRACGVLCLMLAERLRTSFDYSHDTAPLRRQHTSPWYSGCSAMSTRTASRTGIRRSSGSINAGIGP